MKCPMDSSILVMSERSGIEIDYCPECRGVWLDRGELDKIIDRVETTPATRPEQASQPTRSQPSPLMPPPLPSPALRRSPDADGYGSTSTRDNDRRGYDDRRHDDDRRGYDNAGRGYDQRPRRKKKEGFLGELFDF